MRSPENVLKSLSKKAKNKEYRYERLYRNLYNPEFYLLAYQNIATSQGSMTAGADGLTLDRMSMERIEKLIAKLRDHSYQPNPARRVYIAKKNSNKKRPLGIPSTDDKLLQEVVHMILEAIYEPTFSDNSHGFRPKRSCHTALRRNCIYSRCQYGNKESGAVCKGKKRTGSFFIRLNCKNGCRNKRAGQADCLTPP